MHSDISSGISWISRSEVINIYLKKTFANYLPVPFLSLLVEDCIVNGKDYNSGGARYNTTYIQGVGLGSITDMLTSVKYHVYDKKNYTWDEVLKHWTAISMDLKQMQYDMIFSSPKYGNEWWLCRSKCSGLFLKIFYDAVNGQSWFQGRGSPN